MTTASTPRHCPMASAVPMNPNSTPGGIDRMPHDCVRTRADQFMILLDRDCRAQLRPRCTRAQALKPKPAAVIAVPTQNMVTLGVRKCWNSQPSCASPRIHNSRPAMSSGSRCAAREPGDSWRWMGFTSAAEIRQ